MTTDTERPKIVVGIDGSPEADAALRAGYEQARQRGGELVIVHAWTFSPLGPGDDEYGAAEEALADAVDRLLTHVDRDVPITTRLVDGDARHVLVSEAKDAELVVVGTRGRGRTSTAVLGSVSTYLLHHAPCPVEVVPPSPSVANECVSGATS
jgi:nucleotide-binding universal stress UspA family protein